MVVLIAGGGISGLALHEKKSLQETSTRTAYFALD
jgi:hypothetical protein